jgi:hypothetical protein
MEASDKNDKGELGTGVRLVRSDGRIDREVVGADGLEPPTYAV